MNVEEEIAVLNTYAFQQFVEAKLAPIFKHGRYSHFQCADHPQKRLAWSQDVAVHWQRYHRNEFPTNTEYAGLIQAIEQRVHLLQQNIKSEG